MPQSWVTEIASVAQPPVASGFECWGLLLKSVTMENKRESRKVVFIFSLYDTLQYKVYCLETKVIVTKGTPDSHSTHTHTHTPAWLVVLELQQ